MSEMAGRIPITPKNRCLMGCWAKKVNSEKTKECNRVGKRTFVSDRQEQSILWNNWTILLQRNNFKTFQNGSDKRSFNITILKNSEKRTLFLSTQIYSIRALHYCSNNIGPLGQPCGSPCSQLLVLVGRSSNLDHQAGGRGLCVCRLFMKRRSLRVKNRALRAGNTVYSALCYACPTGHDDGNRHWRTNLALGVIVRLWALFFSRNHLQ